MPRRVAKLISAVVKTTAASKKGRKRALVRRMAQGALLAVTLAAARLDVEELTEKKRLFDPGLLDRLRAPLTRFHE